MAGVAAEEEEDTTRLHALQHPMPLLYLPSFLSQSKRPHIEGRMVAGVGVGEDGAAQSDFPCAWLPVDVNLADN